MNDFDRVELNELCSALVDQTISADGHRRLQELLRESGEARRYYVRSMQLSASLYSYASEMQSEPAEPPKVSRFSSRSWLIGSLAAAAAFIFGLWIMEPQPPSRAEPSAELVESVARLTGSKDCLWDTAEIEPGEELAAGQSLKLKTGFAELTFDSGAQLVIEGPAELNVRSAWEAELKRGTVKANVPPEAIGFRVVNAAVEVVDLGTEFSVSAQDDDAAEVFVIKGSVEVHPRDARGQRLAKAVLRERQARRFGKVGPADVRDRDAKFARLMTKVAIDRLAKPLNFARWSFEENTAAQSAVQTSAGAARVLRLPPGMRTVEGRFGSALELNGSGAAIADLLPPLRRGIRTVAFWVRLPQSTSSENIPLVSFPAHRAWGGQIAFGWNARPAEGPIGALRMNTPLVSVVGTTNLLDGKWHHVTVIAGVPGKGRNKPPLRFYVDGRLEAFADKHLHSPPLERSAASMVLSLGSAVLGEPFAHAVIDEVVIIEQAITPQEIRHLMRSNTLVSPDVIATL